MLEVNAGPGHTTSHRRLIDEAMRARATSNLGADRPIEDAVLSAWRTSRAFLERRGWLLVLILTWGFLLSVLDLGWLPNDDGTLAHAADRIRGGEHPHVDFDEPYTGALSYLNALAFEVFGNNLFSLRYPFIVAVGAWMFVLHLLARRVLDPILSALAVSALVLASVLMHLSPMPSWYNLMLGTIALYLAVRFYESGNRWFLLVAGLVVGASTLIKTNGLLMAMSIGLVLAVRAVRQGNRRQITWARSLMVAAAAAIALFLASAPTLSRFTLFLLPLGIVLYSEWRPRSLDNSLAGSLSIPREMIAFGVGIGVPVLAYFAFYWSIGGVEQLWRSIVVTPRVFVEDLGRDVAGLRFAIGTLIPGVVLWRVAKWNHIPRRATYVGLIVLIGLIYLVNPSVAILGLYSTLIWLALSLGALCLLNQRLVHSKSLPHASVAVLLGGLSFQMVQFPTSTPVHLVYSLPLVGLALLMLVAQIDRELLIGVLGAFVVLACVFAVAKLEGRFFADGETGVRTEYVSLSMPRGGLRVPSTSAYVNDVVSAAAELKGEGIVFLTGPDSPEIYYLAEVENPTPVFFDFLSTTRDASATTLAYLNVLKPDVFVNNREPKVSEALSPGRIEGACQFLASFGPREIYIGCH